MRLPLQIVFRDMKPSSAIEAKIRERADKLERFCDRIIGCHVVVEERHRHRQKGNLFQVRVDLKVPEGQLVASRDNEEDRAHEDVYVAIRDAFDSVRRQLESYTQRRQGRGKAHEHLAV